MERGRFAVAMVQRQVMVVQATRTYKRRDKQLDVHTFILFGDNVFLPSPVPQARISCSDILTIFPLSDDIHFEPTTGSMLELPPQAFDEFIELSSRMQRKYELLFSTLIRSKRL